MPVGAGPCSSDVKDDIYLFCRSCLGHSQTYTQNSIGTQVGLVLRAVKLEQKFVYFGLVLDIDIFTDQLGSNGLIDVLDCL